MDFIDELPKSNGKTTIFVVVDRLSKFAHFIPISHPYTAATIAQVFFENIFKLHGMPQSVVCDRDPTFTGPDFSGGSYSGCKVRASILGPLITLKLTGKLRW